jgi:biopolymer transport protein ExbD
MIPMINIVFLLLIFFMIAGQITAIQGQDIVLPETALGAPIDERQVTLQFTENNQLFFNGSPLSLDELSGELDALAAGEISVSLQADKRVKAVDLDKVLTILRARSIAKVTLFTEQKGHQ